MRYGFEFFGLENHLGVLPYGEIAAAHGARVSTTSDGRVVAESDKKESLMDFIDTLEILDPSVGESLDDIRLEVQMLS